MNVLIVEGVVRLVDYPAMPASTVKTFYNDAVAAGFRL